MADDGNCGETRVVEEGLRMGRTTSGLEMRGEGQSWKGRCEIEMG